MKHKTHSHSKHSQQRLQTLRVLVVYMATTTSVKYDFLASVTPDNVYFLLRPKVRRSEVGMFQMCIKLLTAMLLENVEIGGELHIERLYLFCLMWSFGGLLDEKDMKGFNDLLATLSTALV